MPRTVKSEDVKAKVVAFFQSETGHELFHKDHHSDWYVAHDNSLELYLTYSRSTSTHEAWYDMEPVDAKKLASHAAAFIIFVLDDPDHYLVIPAKTLSEQLFSACKKTKDGRYTLNIDLKNGEFHEIPGWKLKPYFKAIEQIPMASEKYLNRNEQHPA